MDAEHLVHPDAVCLRLTIFVGRMSGDVLNCGDMP
jgi:hypothetical protein|tara:strand:- start:425 stop:529 length:105 start_codon:yes stop_codon:yes gene_type:complete